MKFSFEEENISLPHQKIIKEGNIKQLFNLILTHEGISRIAISEKTGLSRSTVSFLVDELVKAEIVNVLGAGSSEYAGRKPIMLKINHDRAQVAAVSLNKNSFVYTLFGLDCTEIESFSKEIEYEKGCGERIWKYIKRNSLYLRPDSLLALCVSIPAQVNNADKSINLSILDIKNDCNLVNELRSMQSDIPLVVGNQSSAYAYAEYKYSFGEEDGDMIFFNMNEGVGAGILLNGRVFTAEIGHMSIDAKGPLCECGKRGCLELYLSRDVMLKRFGAAMRKGKRRAWRADFGSVKKRLDERDRAVMETARAIAGEAALGINNVICMFNPESIFFGGGIDKLGPIFLKMVINGIKTPDSRGIKAENHIKIKYSQQGRDSDLRGIVRYFLDEIFTISVEMENTVYIWN